MTSPKVGEAAGSRGLTVKQEFMALINRLSLERHSNTPDHVLADYLINCLNAFSLATGAREDWYGGHLEPARGEEGPWVTHDEVNVVLP